MDYYKSPDSKSWHTRTSIFYTKTLLRTKMREYVVKMGLSLQWLLISNGQDKMNTEKIG